MDYFEDISCVVEYIELNIHKKINMDDMSGYISLSKYHFQRLFKSIVGETLGNYIKKRKISDAMLQLINTDKSILEIAIDYDFSSNETFTRSFKNIYRVTPREIRVKQLKLELYSKFDVMKKKMFLQSRGSIIKWEIVTIPELKLIGNETVSLNKEDNYPLTKVWKKLISNQSKIENIMNKDIHFNLLGNGFFQQPFIYFGGFEVENFEFDTTGFTLKKISERKYVKFTHENTTSMGFTEGTDETIDLIYNSWLIHTEYKLAETNFELMVLSDERNFLKNKEKSVIELYLPIV